MEDRGYYNNISKDSVEYKNFETFVQMINESSNKGKFDELLNEARVDFSAVGGGLKGIRDIDSKKLKEDMPEVVEKYSKTSNVKSSIRIKLK